MNGDEPTLQLLLVEDDPADTSLLVQQLDSAHAVPFMLRVAGTISDAEIAVLNESIDCVLLDLSLPDSEGVGSVARLHRRAPHIPIIVLTGRDEEDLALQAIEAGAQDFLVKGVVRGDSILRCARWTVARQRAAGVRAASGDRWTVEDREGVAGPCLLDRTDAPVAHVDDDMVIQFVNTAFEELLGFPEPELTGAPFTDLLVADDLIAKLLEIRAVLKTLEPSAVVDVTMRGRGGRTVRTSFAVSRVRPASEKTALLLVALTPAEPRPPRSQDG